MLEGVLGRKWSRIGLRARCVGAVLCAVWLGCVAPTPASWSSASPSQAPSIAKVAAAPHEASPDGDGDGIMADLDRCPMEAEDRDGFEDEDGCPEPDNDKDRIADSQDRCPNEPETFNGRDDADGCPDKGLVIVTSQAITIAGAPSGALIPGIQTGDPEHNTEQYNHIVDNPFVRVGDDPLSTFSVDVDTASYTNVRRFLEQGQLPPKDAVRIEELVNYFPYDYAAPAGTEPFSVSTDVAGCPWSPTHRLVRIGLRGRPLASGQVPPRNLVFLIDVSGSMVPPNKLPLLKRAMAMLVGELNASDRVSIVVYAGASGLILPATPGDRKDAILEALGRLEAGGSTAGGDGIKLAYKVAQQSFIKHGVNRVILATDGDFNVGITSQGDLTRLIEEKRNAGVFLTVLGFGMGNLKDSTLELLADKGDGNYAYIDSIHEARKVLVKEAGATLVTIAKDVKLQVEFNPKAVASYRLIGYENRVLRHQDFKDDKKDAGDIGAGHTVTAFYEIVPAGAGASGKQVDPLKYQSAAAPTPAAASGELLTVKLRFKPPAGSQSTEMSVAVKDDGKSFDRASDDFRFAAAVASFGMLLRDSEHKGASTFNGALGMAAAAKGKDAGGYRGAFVTLVDRARSLAKKP